MRKKDARRGVFADKVVLSSSDLALEGREGPSRDGVAVVGDGRMTIGSCRRCGEFCVGVVRAKAERVVGQQVAEDPKRTVKKRNSKAKVAV